VTIVTLLVTSIVTILTIVMTIVTMVVTFVTIVVTVVATATSLPSLLGPGAPRPPGRRGGARFPTSPGFLVFAAADLFDAARSRIYVSWVFVFGHSCGAPTRGNILAS